MLAGAHNEDQVSNYGNKSGIMVLVDDHIRQMGIHTAGTLKCL